MSERFSVELDVFDIVTIILVAAKAFGYLDISWWACFAPLWVPWGILAVMGLLAYNYWLALLVAILVGSVIGASA